MSNVKSTIQFALVSALSLAAVSTEAQASGDEEVIITAEIKGKTCGLQWHAHAGGNSAVGAKEHIAKFDCGTTEGDPVFLESGTEKIYTLKQGNKCYLEWAGEKNSVHGIWAEERIAKFDCGGGGDTFQIHGNRGADQFVTTKTSTETCHFQWVGSSGGAGVGNNEYIAKWDCEAGKSGDPIRIIALVDEPTHVASDEPTYTLIKSDVECNSSDVSLGSQNTLQDCADACEADSDCDYFVYGKGSKYGGCYQEKTSSSACPEGWETDKYDFYALVAKDGSTKDSATPQPQSPPTDAARCALQRDAINNLPMKALTTAQGDKPAGTCVPDYPAKATCTLKRTAMNNHTASGMSISRGGTCISTEANECQTKLVYNQCGYWTTIKLACESMGSFLHDVRMVYMQPALNAKIRHSCPGTFRNADVDVQIKNVQSAGGPVSNYQDVWSLY